MTHDEAEDIKRHFNVVAEGLRSEIRPAADGHAALDRRIDARALITLFSTRLEKVEGKHS